jgi:uncharacterized membrane protein SirB2
MNSFAKKGFLYSVLFLGLLFFFIFNFPPNTGHSNRVFFVLSFVVVYLISGLLYYFLRKAISGIENDKLARREGIFTGVAGTLVLYLGSQGLIWFWDWFLVVIIFILLEIMLLSKKRSSI